MLSKKSHKIKMSWASLKLISKTSKEDKSEGKKEYHVVAKIGITMYSDTTHTPKTKDKTRGAE